MTACDYFETNINVVKKFLPALAEKIIQTKGTGTLRTITVQNTDSGAPSLLIDGMYIHSRVDPRKEAKKLAAASFEKTAHNAQVDNDGAIIFLGFGLGYI
ncbi:MAG: hypothetical protein LBV52_02470, partial [Spirochaetaceae bacterium]|nr:hypothetical protein [Spirochaetaceae bacterium]